MTTLNRRLRRPSLAMLTKQTGPGVMADDLAYGVNSTRLWSTLVEIEPDSPKSRPGPWMSEFLSENAGSRYSITEKSEGRITVLAVPATVELILRSSWGSFAAGAFTLKSQVNEWFTLAWIEDFNAGSTQRLVRAQDVYFYRVEFVYERKEGRMLIIADYAARQTRVDPLNALPGGVFVPSTNFVPEPLVFNMRNAQFRRDPASANVNIAFERVSVILNQNVFSGWKMSDNWQVYKQGKTFASVEFDGVLTDETWKLIDDNIAGAKEKFRVRAVTDGSPSKTLTIDLFNMDFDMKPIGHTESPEALFSAEGRAHILSGNFVDITLS